MAYERRFSLAFLFFGLIGSLASAAHSLTDALRSFGTLFDWPDFKPDAMASLALDRIARFGASLSLPAIASRFKSFVNRALTHDEWSGDHFDPGRQPA